MLRTLGTVAVATGMMHAMAPSTVLALREAVAVVSTLAVLDGADALAVGEGQRGERSRDSGAKAVKRARRVVMTGVSLPEWTRCLVEKEESIDELWHGKSSFLPPQRLT